jgi:hypothetical protein
MATRRDYMQVDEEEETGRQSGRGSQIAASLNAN